MTSPHAAFILVCLMTLSACGSDQGTRPLGDRTPPAAVTDLNVTSLEPSDALLFWTAPGDDGMSGRAFAYELRHWNAPITEANWDSAVVVDSLPAPHDAGWPENLRFSGVEYGPRYFALRASDEARNRSALSNVAEETWVDATPPSAVADLEVEAASTGEMILHWTAPGGDGNGGRASRYALRYAPAPISDATWDEATPIDQTLLPAASGSRESLSVPGLPKHQWFYFALRTADEWPNWSALSNQPRACRMLTRLFPLDAELRNVGHPAWSPDGLRIAFDAKSASGHSGIYLVDVAGGAPTRITPDDGDGYYPAWSPDGARIAFSGYFSHSPGIWSIEPSPGATPERVCSLEWEVYQLDWSPDGTQIAFGAGDWPFAASIQAWVFTIPVGGSSAKRLTTPFFVNEWSPRFSPDGSSIVFASERGQGQGTFLWRVPAEGGDPIRLTQGSHQEVEPAWSRDGRFLAYTTSRHSRGDLWRVSSDGSDAVQLTFGGGGDRSPSWSPDGSRIVFTSDGSGRSELWILTLEP